MSKEDSHDIRVYPQQQAEAYIRIRRISLAHVICKYGLMQSNRAAYSISFNCIPIEREQFVCVLITKGGVPHRAQLC